MTAQELKVVFGERFDLDVPRLELRAGEILSVMGPSGSGKTTLLRLLATLERPSRGEIRFGDLVWSAQASGTGGFGPAGLLAWRRRVGFVHQNPVLFSGTVEDNVSLGLELRGTGGGKRGRAGRDSVERLREKIGDRVKRGLATVGLDHLARERVDSLSAGEAQRVALARALVPRPQVLFLDEPTANLDPANVTIIEKALAEAVESWRPAVLLVTHNLFQARRVADRTGLLIGGRMVELGPTRQVFEQPTDPRTEAFVKGEMIF